MHALPRGAYRGLRRFLSAQEGQVGDVLGPGQVVAHYEVEDVVGSGGTGIVYRAHDVRLGRRVALKVLSPHLAGDAATRERIGLETMVVAALDHPNVLPLFEAEEAEGVLYLVSQWIAGRDVGKLVAQKGPVAVEEAVRIVTDVASALHAARRVGVVHRGVMPSNVLVADNGHDYLSDFGIDPPASDRTGLTGTKHLPPQWPSTGTLNYISPEQIRGEHVDARDDVHGLGGLASRSAGVCRTTVRVTRRITTSYPPTHRRRPERAATCPISSTP